MLLTLILINLCGFISIYIMVIVVFEIALDIFKVGVNFRPKQHTIDLIYYRLIYAEKNSSENVWAGGEYVYIYVGIWLETRTFQFSSTLTVPFSVD